MLGNGTEIYEIARKVAIRLENSRDIEPSKDIDNFLLEIFIASAKDDVQDSFDKYAIQDFLDELRTSSIDYIQYMADALSIASDAVFIAERKYDRVALKISRNPVRKFLERYPLADVVIMFGLLAMLRFSPNVFLSLMLGVVLLVSISFSITSSQMMRLQRLYSIELNAQYLIEKLLESK